LPQQTDGAAARNRRDDVLMGAPTGVPGEAPERMMIERDEDVRRLAGIPNPIGCGHLIVIDLSS